MNASSLKIFFGLVCSPPYNWQAKFESLATLQVTELGLFLLGVPLATRREIYRRLEKSSVVKIPYVQLPLDADDSEIEYIVQKYKTSIFSLPPIAESYTIASRRASAPQTIVIQNPSPDIKNSEFNEEALARPGVAGICLDTATLEADRLHRPKLYQTNLFALDHHPVLCSLISPVSHSLLSRFTGNPSRLTNLNSLRYLHNIVPKYLATTLILKLDNFFDEQLEVKQYLETILSARI